MNNSSRNSKTARMELERALSLHFQGNKVGALKSLKKALELDPILAKDAYASNLAKEITGLPLNEALNSLIDDATSRELIDTAQIEKRTSLQMRPQRNLLPVLAGLLILIVGLCIWSYIGGAFDPYLNRIRMAQLLNQRASLDGYDYYVIVPRGDAPENGWPALVAFHGYGGDGSHVLQLADTFTDAGAIFIAPSLGEYQPNPGRGPLEPVSRILIEVGKHYPLQSRGAILLGHSQGGSFAYRFSVYYPDLVAGVVTAGAPEFDAILPSRNIPYIFTWGELDGLQQFVLPMVYPIQNSGYNVRTAIVPGVGHAMSQYAVDQALLLLGQP